MKKELPKRDIILCLFYIFSTIVCISMASEDGITWVVPGIISLIAYGYYFFKVMGKVDI